LGEVNPNDLVGVVVILLLGVVDVHHQEIGLEEEQFDWLIVYCFGYEPSTVGQLNGCVAVDDLHWFIADLSVQLFGPIDIEDEGVVGGALLIIDFSVVGKLEVVL
jgi:hypothetical protein